MNLTEHIIASPSGGTLSLEGNPLPVTGYFVGGLVSPLIVEDATSVTGLRADLNAFIEYLNGPTVAADYVGWWTDEETGRLWVDATTWHETEFEAGRVGRQRREIAVYDIERQRELRLAYVEGE
jgi:hypothetical protein